MYATTSFAYSTVGALYCVLHLSRCLALRVEKAQRSRGFLRRSSAVQRFASDPAWDTAEDTNFIDQYVKGSNVTLSDLDSLPSNTSFSNRTQPRRSLVVARYDEDLSWLKHLPQYVDVWVYQSKDSSGEHYVDNFGNEATKYLSFLVDNYAELPDSMVFVQAGRQDWHDPVPKDVLLRRWSWGEAAEHGGMKNLPTNAPCLIEDANALGPHVLPQVPMAEMCMAVVEHSPKQMQTIREVWPTVFENELGVLPQRWLTHCCAQFEVSKEAVYRHPREFYSSLLSWAIQHDRELSMSDYAGDMKRNHDPQRRDAGHVLEPLWSLLFTDPASRIVFPDVQSSDTT